jgi:tryptophanyl-tRNA synthetase
MSKGVTPWEFELEHIDYARIIQEFGLQPMTSELLKRMKSSHRLFKRQIIFAHRDFDRILDAQEKQEQFVVLTGMMPSGRFHFGHKVIADLMAWYQQQGVMLYIPVSDIEAHVIRGIDLDTCKDIIINEYVLNYLALGVDLVSKDRCCLYSQWRNDLVRNLSFKAASKITLSQMHAMYGFSNSDNMGKIFFPFIDAADILHPQLPERGGVKPVLVPVGVDQDIHLRLSRDLAPRFGMLKPSSIYTKMMSGLQGPGTKMSSSKPETAIFLSDSPEVAKQKLKDAFTGGRETIQEQKRMGGQPERCVVYEFLLFHFEDELLEVTYDRCKSGNLMCGDCKAVVSDRVVKFLAEVQRKREEAKSLLPKVFENQLL